MSDNHRSYANVRVVRDEHGKPLGINLEREVTEYTAHCRVVFDPPLEFPLDDAEQVPVRLEPGATQLLRDGRATISLDDGACSIGYATPEHPDDDE